MSKVSKKSFIFNYEWQEVLKDYPAEVRLEVYDAIIEYAISGTLFELKPLAKMAFSFIKLQIDYNNEKYEGIVEKRREAGRKGMQKRYQKSELDITNDNKDNKCYQKVTSVTDNDIVTDNDVVIEKDNNIVIHSSEEISDEKGSPKKLKVDYEGIVARFNSTLSPPLPKVVKITEQRKKTIRNRVEEHGSESIDIIIQKISESNFLLGKTESGWMCTFDWVFCPRNYVKILEGNYANNRSNYSEKQRANEYAFQQFVADRQQREQGVANEVEKPF